MTFYKTMTTAAVVAGALGAATAASAGTIDFSNIADNGSPIGPFALDDANFTVSADTFDVVQPAFITNFDINLNNLDGAEVTVNAEGLGVNNGGAPNPGSDDVDGRNNNDILLFAFDRAVELLRIDFDNVDANDDFVFFAADSAADLIGDISVTFIDIAREGSSDEGGFNFASGVVGSIFGIGAVQDLDNFRVEGLTANVSAVPVPAAGFLLLAGLGGLVLGSRRKKKSDA